MPALLPTKGGFTLVELVVVIVIIAILAAVAVPTFRDATDEAEVAAVARQLNTLAGQAEAYYADNGAWPGNTLPSRFPNDLAKYVSSSAFTGEPLGGKWDWNGPGNQVGKIGPNVVVQGSLSTMQSQAFAEVDTLIDDGDLTTGTVRQFSVAGHRVLQYILADD